MIKVNNSIYNSVWALNYSLRSALWDYTENPSRNNIWLSLGNSNPAGHCAQKVSVIIFKKHKSNQL